MSGWCESCNWKWEAKQLENRIDELKRELNREQSKVDKLETQVRDLRPYKERSDRAYDQWVTNPERGRDE